MKITKSILTTAVLAAISGSVFAAETTLPSNVYPNAVGMTTVGNNNRTIDTTLTSQSTIVGANNEIKRATNNTTVIGASNSIDGKNNVTVGMANSIAGHSSVAIGYHNTASAYKTLSDDEPIDLSVSFAADGVGATAIGSHSKVYNQLSTAIGYNAQAGGENNVALGSYSSASDTVHTADAKYAGVSNNKGVVSIGAIDPAVNLIYDGMEGPVKQPWQEDFTRQLQRVSAGEVSATSTDAVNGSQLQDAFDRSATNATNIATNAANIIKAKTTVTAGNGVTVTDSTNANGSTNYEVSVAKALTDQVEANKNAIANLNDNAVVQGGENIHIADVNGNQRGVSLARNLQHMESAHFGHDDDSEDTLITKNTIGMGSNITGGYTNMTAGAVHTSKGSEDTGMTEKGITIENTDNVDRASFTVGGMQASDSNGTVRFTTTDITAGNQQIHGVKAGTADTDAVNVKQLNDKIGALKDNDTITTVTAGDNTVVTSTGHDYKVAVSKTLTDMTSATFGSGDTRNVIDKGSIRVFDGSVNTGITSNGMTIENTDTLEQASYTGSGMQVSDDNATVRFTTTNIDAGNQIVHGVKAGVADTDAVNVKQLKDFMSSNDNDTITTVKAGSGIKVTNTDHDYTVALDDKTIDQINTTETGMKGNARDIAKLKVDVVEAKTSVSVGDGLHVKPSYNTNGSTNYHVTIDSKVTDQIKGNTDAIKANSTNIADNKARIDDLANKIDTNNSNYNRVISNNQKEARHGIAGASALAAMHPLDYDPEHKMDVMAGVGHFKGSTAVAIGGAYRPNENLMFTLGASLNGSDSTINAGVTYKVGTDAKDTYHSKASMMNKIKQLETTVEEQNAQIEKLMKIVDALVPANTQA